MGEPQPFLGKAKAPEAARRLFEDLHWGIPAKRARHVRTRASRALAELGRLESITYSTNKRGDGPSDYVHTFGEEGGRKPRLAVDAETRDLVIVGGDYTVEPRGIVD
jgi:hypothetical protein